MDSLQNNFVATPQIVSDIVLFKEKFLGKDKYYLLSDEREKYIKLTGNQYKFYEYIIPYLDGKHSMEEFDNILIESSAGKYNAEKVINILSSSNLLEERTDENKTKVELELSSKKILDVSLDNIQSKITKLIKCIDVGTQIIGISSIVWALFLLIFNQDLVREVYRETKLFSWKNVKPTDFLIIVLLSLLSVVIHEIGHLLAADRHHVVWKRFIFALKWGVSPVYYIRYKNFYSNRSRNRIIILGSGVYFNLVQASIYYILLVYTYDWKMAVMAIINMGITVSCLLPSGTSDGYHMLAVIFGIEGVRWKMLTLVSSFLKGTATIKKTFSDKKNILLIAYFVISYVMGIYGCYLLLGTIIEYLHIFSADRFYAIVIVTAWVIISVIINLVKFVKNLKHI